MASNHQLYEMYILNYINQMCFHKDLYFAATPYLNKSEFDLNNAYGLCSDEYYKKLCMLYQLKWKCKNCSYDVGIFKRIKKLDYDNKLKLYDYICECNKFDSDNISKYLNDFLIRYINIQNNIKILHLNKGGI